MDTTFSSVSESGYPSVDVVSSGPAPPTGYQVVGVAGQPVYFHIDTTATFSGPVTICISYDQTQVVGPESGLKLMHYVGAGFVDITGSVDPVNNVICGQTTNLSPFAIVQPALAVGGIAEAPNIEAGAAVGNSPSLLYAALAAAAVGVVVLAAGGWYARRRWRAG